MLIDEIKKANIEALKNHNNVKRGILGIVMTKYKLLEVENRAKGKDIADADLINIIQKTLKELEDEKAGYELVNNIQKINEVIEQGETLKFYLPKLLNETEIKNIISNLPDKSIPFIMKHFKTNYPGKVDMSLVNKIAREL